jgi:hypothetical protein
VANPKDANLQVAESYSVTVVRGDRRTGSAQAVTNATRRRSTFDKPVDNIGSKTIPDYAGYAAKHVYTVNIPGCAMPAKAVRRPAPGPVRGQPGHHLRPGQRAGVGHHRPALIGAACPTPLATRTSPRWRWRCTRAA